MLIVAAVTLVVWVSMALITLYSYRHVSRLEEVGERRDGDPPFPRLSVVVAARERGSPGGTGARIAARARLPGLRGHLRRRSFRRPHRRDRGSAERGRRPPQGDSRRGVARGMVREETRILARALAASGTCSSLPTGTWCSARGGEARSAPPPEKQAGPCRGSGRVDDAGAHAGGLRDRVPLGRARHGEALAGARLREHGLLRERRLQPVQGRLLPRHRGTQAGRPAPRRGPSTGSAGEVDRPPLGPGPRPIQCAMRVVSVRPGPGPRQRNNFFALQDYRDFGRAGRRSDCCGWGLHRSCWVPPWLPWTLRSPHCSLLLQRLPGGSPSTSPAPPVSGGGPAWRFRWPARSSSTVGGAP